MASGTLICESLRVGAVLDAVVLTVSAIERVAPANLSAAQREAGIPERWTLVHLGVDDADAPRLADALAEVLDEPGWYADLHTAPVATPARGGVLHWRRMPSLKSHTPCSRRRKRPRLNGRLGVTGAFTDVIENLGRRSIAFDWRGWFLIGLIAGGAAFALIAGGPDFHGYGWLTDTSHGGAQIIIAPVLVVAGVLIGYGSKIAGGCTSGNGLTGTSMLSPASLVATATFFATAIAVTFVIGALI